MSAPVRPLLALEPDPSFSADSGPRQGSESAGSSKNSTAVSRARQFLQNPVEGQNARNENAGYIRTIEWHMMDKKKFFPMSMASSFTVRCFLYPLTLVRTRLQVQYQSDVYRGTWDAFGKIVKNEGVRGLYRGFWVSAFQVKFIHHISSSKSHIRWCLACATCRPMRAQGMLWRHGASPTPWPRPLWEVDWPQL